eukprot:symbB.v1.2.002016.t1/scaffold87.1/size343203/12
MPGRRSGSQRSGRASTSTAWWTQDNKIHDILEYAMEAMEAMRTDETNSKMMFSRMEVILAGRDTPDPCSTLLHGDSRSKHPLQLVAEINILETW